jgi:Protein of unknown function (DUF2478)
MTNTTARIAAVEGVKSSTVQALFEQAVGGWRAAGVRVIGLIEETHGLPDRTCNAGVLRDIVSGKSHSIYLEIPPSNSSCHIDAAGAEIACGIVLSQIEQCDLVVLSKFGKLEAGSGGLIDAFRAAIAAGKPVLTSISDKHLDAWRAFAPMAKTLPANSAALQDWWNGAEQS